MNRKDRITAWLEGAGSIFDLGGVSFATNFYYVPGSMRDDAEKLRRDGLRVQQDFTRAYRKLKPSAGWPLDR